MKIGKKCLLLEFPAVRFPRVSSTVLLLSRIRFCHSKLSDVHFDHQKEVLWSESSNSRKRNVCRGHVVHPTIFLLQPSKGNFLYSFFSLQKETSCSLKNKMFESAGVLLSLSSKTFTSSSNHRTWDTEVKSGLNTVCFFLFFLSRDFKQRLSIQWQ